MLKIKIKEGILEIDNKKIVIRHTLEAGLFENVFNRIVNKWKKKEDSISLKDITMVVYERGIQKTMCPHILIYYIKSRSRDQGSRTPDDKVQTLSVSESQRFRSDETRVSSRLVEFCEDETDELQKVLDFLEKKKIELGVAFEAK